MGEGNGGLEALKTQWASGGWEDRREIWGKADAMVRAQLVLLRDDGALDAEGGRFYKEIIQDENETYFVRGHAALALSASPSSGTMIYLSGKMDRDTDGFDTSRYVRAMCAQSMGRNSDFVEAMPAKEREKVLSVLRKALDNDEPVVVENAIFALGQLHDEASAADMYAAARSKLAKPDPATGEMKARWETVALAFCEMGLNEKNAISTYIRVLEECQDFHVAERIREFAEELIMHSQFDGKKRLADALEIYGRKVQLSELAGDVDRPDSVVGAAVFRRRPSAVPPEKGPAAKPPPLPVKLRLG
jgi:hypothetical protein